MSAQSPSASSVFDDQAHRTGRRTRMWWIGGALLVAATLIVYWPTLSYGFVGWDDDRNVTMNPMVNSPGGIMMIWTSLRGPGGFPNYPLCYTSFWIEYRLWGSDPRGYHATNLGLHALNALLAMCLLRRLGLSHPVAWAAALLFALHPVQVESVAWITERKNVLSAAFYLTGFLLYARYRAAGQPVAYGLALAAYFAALLSKTATVTLVPSLFLADCFIFGDPRRLTRETVSQSIGRLWPFLMLGVLAGYLLVSAEDRPPDPPPWTVRPLIAALGTWFYLGKLVLPTGLAPIYPRWAVSAAAPLSWLALAGLALGLGAAWRWRTKLGGHVLWSLGHFIATLLPVLGLMPFGYQSHSFVADRFVYLACLGPFVILVLAAERILQALPRSRASPLLLPGVASAVAVCLAALTRQQLPIWRSSADLWSYAIRMNPQSWVAQGNYGSVLYLRREYREAIEHWRECVRLEPKAAPVHVKIAKALRALGDLDGAVAHLRRAAQENPAFPDLQAALADTLAATGRVNEAVRMLQETATRQRCPLAYERLAWIYATWPAPAWRNGREAIRLADSAVQLTQGQQAQPFDTLAAAYAEAGDFRRAVATAEKALHLAQREEDQALTAEIQSRLDGYRNGRPYRQE